MNPVSNWLPFMLVGALVLSATYVFFMDTPARRELIAWQVRRLKERVRPDGGSSSGGNVALAKLLKMARSTDRFRACFAIWAIGSVGGALGNQRDAVLKLLGASITGDDPFVRHAAATALSALGTGAIVVIDDLVKAAALHADETAGQIASRQLVSFDQDALVKLSRAKLRTATIATAVFALEKSKAAGEPAIGKALSDLEPLVLGNPTDTTGATLLARLYAQRDQNVKNARKVLTRTIKARKVAKALGVGGVSDSDTAHLYYILAGYYARSGGMRFAMPLLRKAVEVDAALKSQAAVDPDFIDLRPFVDK